MVSITYAVQFLLLLAHYVLALKFKLDNVQSFSLVLVMITFCIISRYRQEILNERHK